jgi:hypothetical protein
MSIQPALFSLPPPARPALADVAPAAGAKARGAVFTRRAVVDFMLDLAGYTADRPLHQLRLLEPSFGGGGFVLAAAGRLLEAWRDSPDAGDDSALDDAIRAVEVDPATFASFHAALVGFMLGEGLPELSARRLAGTWLANEDFLFSGHGGSFNVVVGNPPYVRQENMSPGTLARCRAEFATMVGRADLYVPFFDAALGLLAPGGRLSFICADAWTKNDYGRELRRLVAGRFALRVYVDMYGVDAFESEVGAYPSITVIQRAAPSPVAVGQASSADAVHLAALARSLGRTASVGQVPVAQASSGDALHPAGLAGSVGPTASGTMSVAAPPGGTVRLVPHPGRGGGPWLLRADRRLDAVRLLEARCGTLEQAGCRVGIGVATGADRVFVAPFDQLDVEDSRRLPLAVNRDVAAGVLSWTGQGVVNPWAEEGGLVDLRDYPRLAAYLAPHQRRLAGRHTARRDSERLWYKTIDRITPSLRLEPKLLVPDIRGDGDAIAHDPGTLYPHHNLYYITSADWDLRALQAVLRSGMAGLFVDAYAVRIGGGYLRFQAQYLRRIRLPRWDSVERADQDLLAEAGKAGQKVGVAALERVYMVPSGTLACLADGAAT